jgi:hypothetical protein
MSKESTASRKLTAESRTGTCPSRGSSFCFLFSACYAFLTVLPGCRNCELVEAELRSREAEVRALRERLHHTICVNQALQNELDACRHSAAKVNADTAPPYCVVSGIILGRQTGGHNGDRAAGDEALLVVLEPRDPSGRTVKAAGTVHVEVEEIDPEGKRTPLCTWDIPPERLSQSWRQGLWSSAYHLILPWKNWPTADKLWVGVQLTVGEGHIFKAEKTVSIRPPPPAQRKPAKPPETDQPLPPPRKVEPPPQTSKPVTPPATPTTASEVGKTWQSPTPLYSAIQIGRPEPLENPLFERH